MNPFRATSSPCTVRQEGRRVIFENAYQVWVHDLDQGGELVEARVKNGSGRNLLVQPQRTLVGLAEDSHYHNYTSCQLPAVHFKIEETPAGPCLTAWQMLADATGAILPGLSITHKTTYHEWGYAEHKLIFQVAKTVENLGQLQIGTFYADPKLDACHVRTCTIENSSPWGANSGAFRPMTGGQSRSDCPVYCSHYLPLSVTLLKRGLEAIEFALDDDLAAWDALVDSPLHWQLCYLSFSKAANAYEMRFSALDVLSAGQSIPVGTHQLGYRMTMPFIQNAIVPLRPCSGNILQPRGFDKRWPTADDIASWKEAGVTLMRLHNDGDSYDNGIFWRDADYPPYPADEMAKMDATLAACNAQGINVVPYFSVKEFHPRAADYKEHAEEWGRRAQAGAPLLINRCRADYFGAQMCLESDWFNKRRATIQQVLDNHAFKGVYYDWCAGAECVSDTHGNGRHWDNDKLLQHLEWSHQRAGEDGDVYLHLTHTPSLAAENLASLVLTEESGYAKLSPTMFTAHVHYMNIAPRQICDMLPGNATAAEHRILAMAALLHHATISSVHPDYLAFYKEIEQLRQDVVNYRRHAAPGEGKVDTDNQEVGAALYWNESKALLLLANLSQTTQSAAWSIKQSDDGPLFSGREMLEPLQLKTISLNIQLEL